MSEPYIDTDPEDVPNLSHEELRAVAAVALEDANDAFESDEHDWNAGLAPMRGVMALRYWGGDPRGIAGALELHSALLGREGEIIESARHKIRAANPPI